MSRTKPPEERLVSICGSVRMPVRARIIAEANKRNTTPAMVLGGIVTEWVEQHPLPVDDPNQVNMFDEVIDHTRGRKRGKDGKSLASEVPSSEVETTFFANHMVKKI